MRLEALEEEIDSPSTAVTPVLGLMGETAEQKAETPSDPDADQ